MKYSFLIATTFVLASINLHAQDDTTALLKEVTGNIQAAGPSVSSFLTNKRYAVLHPLTSFRETIKKNASTGSLTITTQDEPGKKIKVTGVVKNKNGQPVPDALVYVYQTSSSGWYAADKPHVGGNEGDRRHARLFGYIRTDINGNFELNTVKPSGYPNSDLPAHIHIEITATGYPSYISELLFDDDERLQGEIRTRAAKEGFIISKPKTIARPFDQLFTYELSL